MLSYYGKQIPKTQRNQERLERLRREAQELLNKPIFALSFSKFRMYHETGNRLDYEEDYMEHRRRINVMTVLLLSQDPMDEDDAHWKAALEDALWAVCDEVTWAFPAHIARNADPQAMLTRIDLFAAETAMALSEICYLLKERLHSKVYDRVQYELRRRVLAPYLETPTRYNRNNWSSVCACGIGCAFLYSAPQDFETAKAGLLTSMQDYLDSFTEDGCCLEGPLYWSYGFSHYCFFAKLLREYTQGKVDLFQNPKVKEIALYCQRMALTEDFVIPFADSPHRYPYEYCLMNLLQHEYEEFIPPAPQALALHEYGDHGRERFGRFLRDFYWTSEELPPKLSQGRAPERWTVFESSQQYVCHFLEYIFAAKGGHNSEPHNHNDLGTFLLFTNGQYLLDDLGWGEYDNLYFGARRYENLCTSSRGHSVPIINGREQRVKAKAQATAIPGENRIALELSDAYDVEGFLREFQLGEDGKILLKDSFADARLQITERFVTRLLPEITGDTVRIGRLSIQCREACRIEVSQQEFHPRALGDLQETETAYLIDFIFEEVQEKMEISFELSL